MSLVRFLLLATTKPVKIFVIKMLIYIKKMASLSLTEVVIEGRFGPLWWIGKDS